MEQIHNICSGNKLSISCHVNDHFGISGFIDIFLPDICPVFRTYHMKIKPGFIFVANAVLGNEIVDIILLQQADIFAFQQRKQQMLFAWRWSEAHRLTASGKHPALPVHPGISQFAKAVMDAVSSQAFVVSPSAPYLAVFYAIGDAVNNTHRVYT